MKKNRARCLNQIKSLIPKTVKKILKIPIYNIFNAKYLIACSIADNAYVKIISGNNSEALKLFIRAVDIVGYDNKELIIECFKKLSQIETNNELNLITQGNPLENRSDNKQLLLVEGMVCTGNTATRDFLAHYKDIINCADRSQKFVREKYGLNDFLTSLEKKRNPLHVLIMFFGKHILGLSSSESFEEISNFKETNNIDRVLHQARTIMKSSSQLKVLNAFLNFLNLFDQLRLEHQIDSSLEVGFRRQINDFVINYLEGNVEEKNGSFIMVRNMFKLSFKNYKTLEFLDNYIYIATIRDPRAQFVDMVRQGMAPSVSKFVEDVKTSYALFNQNINNGLIDSKKVLLVQFEDLVLSEKYRQELINKIGVNINNMRDFSKFKPSDSEKNLFIYKEFKDQDSIKFIERNLSEYLYSLNQ